MITMLNCVLFARLQVQVQVRHYSFLMFGRSGRLTEANIYSVLTEASNREKEILNDNGFIFLRDRISVS